MNDTVFATFAYPDCEKHLPRMLRSLNEQTDPDFDLIIFNDGLADIDRMCENFLSKSVRIQPVQGTIAEIRTEGLMKLKQLGYKNVIFGDVDDSFSRNRISVLKKLLRENDIVVNDINIHSRHFSRPEMNYFQGRIPAEKIFDASAIRSHNFIGFTNSAIRTSVIPEVSFSDDLVAVDWAFFSIILQQKVRAIFTSCTTTSYYINDTSHYDLISTNAEIEYFKSIVRECHYRYLCKSGFGFVNDYKMAVVLRKKLEESQKDLGPEREYKDWRSKRPLWWEMYSDC